MLGIVLVTEEFLDFYAAPSSDVRYEKVRAITELQCSVAWRVF